MHNQIDQGWLRGAARCPSENYSERSEGVSISLLVIHNISLPPGEFGGGFIQKFFTNQLDCQLHPWFSNIEGVKVSAHLLIDRQGSVTQFVPFERCAWHAGVSSFLGREGCNDFSIGIELEGADSCPYTEAQYQTLSAVTRTLMATYPDITPERLAGHSDIAPGRKTDPGPAFDWQRLHRLLRDAPQDGV
jgi:AmpD protein